MYNPHPSNLRVNQLPEVIITDHNITPKFKAQSNFVRNIVVFCINLYPYHGEVNIDELIE